VIEAAASGTPSVVVAGADNAAVELIRDGENGFVAASPQEMPAAIAAVHEAGPALRERTSAWFRERAPQLTAARSARQILETLGA
jgi:glycosyltransferase involved in cell wall biosynthesis